MIRQQLDILDDFVQGMQQALKSCRPGLVSLVTRIQPLDPLSFYAAAGQWFHGQRLYWSTPDHEFTLVGLGTAVKIESDQDTRFDDVTKEWKHLIANTHIHTEGEVMGTGPLLLGGFSFDPQKPSSSLWQNYKAASFILPQFLLTQSKNQSYLTINAYIHPEDDLPEKIDQLNRLKERLITRCMDFSFAQEVHPITLNVFEPAREEWLSSVKQVIAEIQQGVLQKVVLARRVEVESETPFRPEQILNYLRQVQTSSYVFSIEWGENAFVGATPERLIKKEGSRVLSTCLAGSIKRGQTLEEDLALSKALLQDPKNRVEHEIVVRMIKQALGDLCTRVEAPDQPIIYKTKQIQHLYTPVRGLAKDNISLLKMVEALHPTPALGGYPREEAVRRIRELEGMDRGWYAAPIGWLDRQGNGEFVVAIRSALIRHRQATLFAGCGIVEDSDPQSEYEETQMKLKPMLSALGGH
ncbi:isochorismate synthase [Caldalkalibacillus thermarum TA2.A1]|uniref:Isochorismate synthase MenF n=1 Tax=Caldalkalibacillus thermarum (strain TA2.A1) TaxID=986075 RepID=F5L4C4_CALTT|nr:isochorismate synthase [Caldalkalibacillus thermarum]EGL83820.1 isochorismate synthase [Caldalkalibacillus thermarum TA2.A1]QZT32853.1 isochorismate synthase [Caldalkalibacillus thermarum TA2.A1]